MKELTHFSLFTGVGGLDLAAEWAGFTTVGQCEYADYPTKVLEKHWPGEKRWKDVRELTVKSIRERGIGEITVLSGGFPCQPHSVAGKRKASGDERDLWPEYRRLIGEIKPKWVVAENVRGLLTSEDGRFFRGILRDLADLGFNVGWGLWGACDVGAVHRRERVFVVAHNSSIGGLEQQTKIDAAERYEAQHGFDGYIAPVADTNSKHVERRGTEQVPREQKIQGELPSRSIEEWQRRCSIFKPKLCRTFNGIPHQVDRLKCLGNAVVPQQAYPIFKAIADIERG